MQEQIYYLRASSLSHDEFCNKRSKIEVFLPFSKSGKGSARGPIAMGNRLHGQYSYIGVDFDSNLVLKKLERYLIRGSFQKQIDNIVVRGVFDNLRVITYQGKKYSVLSELKTIIKKKLWSREIKAAIRQLQIYMWLVRDYLKDMNYPLWERGYLEIYSQHTGYLIKRIPVEYDENIEDWIRDVVSRYKGLSRVSTPPLYYCKRCPVQVRNKCSWYSSMRDVYGKERNQ